MLALNCSRFGKQSQAKPSSIRMLVDPRLNRDSQLIKKRNCKAGKKKIKWKIGNQV